VVFVSAWNLRVVVGSWTKRCKFWRVRTVSWIVIVASFEGFNFLLLWFHLRNGMLPWLSIRPAAWHSFHSVSCGLELAIFSAFSRSVWTISEARMCRRDVVLSSWCHFADAPNKTGMMLSGPG
jgi:hypothetical protein